MLKALTYLEQKKIAHNDIKPANFLIDQYGRIKLTDFGLSKYVHHDKDFSKDFLGSLPFMSPELVSHKPYHPIKSDVWSFGATVYYLVSGKLPFQSTTYSEWKKAIRLGLYSIPPQTNQYVKNILQRTLVLDPEERASFAELKSIVDIALADFDTKKSNLPLLPNAVAARSTSVFKTPLNVRPHIRSLSMRYVKLYN